MLTLILILLPVVVAGLVAFIKGENAKKIALAGALAELGLTVNMLAQFNPDGGTQFILDYWWVKELGIGFSVGVDGISLAMLLLTNILIPLIILSSFNRKTESPNALYSLVSLMQFALVGVFVAMDAFLFYVFWELALIPVYFICAFWGGQNRIKVTLKFFIYTLFGSLLMLLSFIYLYLHTPGEQHLTFIQSIYKANLSRPEQIWVFIGIFVAFAIKVPLFPFHTWQPDTYTESSTTGTMLLSGIMLKMGLYGIIRWLLPVVPDVSRDYSKWVIIMAISGVLYASVIAIKQNNVKRLLAYSSMAHVGLIAAGFFTAIPAAWTGGVFQMFAHGINVVGLFLIADILIDRTKLHDIRKMGGIANQAPTLAIAFFLLVLGSVGFPSTDSFNGEFLMFFGFFQWNAKYMIFAGVSIILAAIYLLRLYQKTMFGVKSEFFDGFKDLFWSEKIVLGVCIMLMFILGIYPSIFIQIFEPAVRELLRAY